MKVTIIAYTIHIVYILTVFPYFTSPSPSPFDLIENISGYIPIGSQAHESIFFWLFKHTPSHKHPYGRPTPPLIWHLQGGPACSDMHPIFYENGPFNTTKNGNNSQGIPGGFSFTVNKNSWTEVGDVLYVDQPIGTGFSYIEDRGRLPEGQGSISLDLYRFMRGFLEEYEEYKGRELYLAGSSYAGHYIPPFVYNYLLDKNTQEYPKLDIKLSGIYLLNPYISPISQLPTIPKYAYENGLLTEIAYIKSELEFLILRLSIALGNYNICRRMYGNGFKTVLGGIPYKASYFDVSKPCVDMQTMCLDLRGYKRLTTSKEFQELVGGEKYRGYIGCNSHTQERLFSKDYWVDYEGEFKYIIEQGVRMVVEAGDKDLLCNWRGVLRVLGEGFREEVYEEWEVGGVKVGNIRVSQGVLFVTVYNSGHILGMDHPQLSLLLLNTLVHSTNLI